MLSFRLLGTSTLYNNGEPLTQFRSPKEPALLFYLAHTGRSHTRDAVADLLWDGRTTVQARSNLRTILARLRKQVGEALKTTRSSVSLAHESLGPVDSVQLLHALSSFEQVESTEDVRALQELLSSYDGDFLADFHLSDAPGFHAWMTTTREQIRRQVIAAYGKLGRFVLTANLPEPGIAIAQSWLQVDSLDEAAHALLLRMLLAQGRRREANAHYDHCVALLRAELDAEPSPELTALIRDAQPAPPLSPPRQLRHNLPPSYNQFFGREIVQQEIHSRLDQPWCRLVTIVGQGGVGKSRLATTIARSRLGQYADGVWLVELAEVDPADDDLSEAIATEIATAIDLRFSGSAKPTAQLIEHLQHKQALLILDNFEHVLDGVPIVLDILQRCEGVQILATSREALRVRAEWTIDLAGLGYPANGADETPSAAVDLFVARRAQQQRAPVTPENLAAARVICRMVEGLPLAIELAAALTRDASSQEIAAELSADFDKLSASLRDVPKRHSSLQTVFAMSWRTLSAELQTRLARLATFRGGFSPEAARHVARAEEHQLAALQAKSLLTFDEAANRYALHPVVRAYAGAKRPLDDPAPRRHAEHFLSLLVAHAQPLRGNAPQECIALILPDLDNVRLAWQTALAARIAPLLVPALPALSSIYQLRGLAQEGEGVMQATVHAASEWGGVGSRLAVRAGLEQARFQNRLGRYRPAMETAQSALALAESSGDRWAEGMGHILWGESLWRVGEYDGARQKLLHALALAESMASAASRSADVTLLVGWSHHHLGVVDDIQGRYADSRLHLERACDAWRAMDYTQALSNSLNSIGLACFHHGDLQAAQEAMESALTLCRQTDNRHLQSLLLNNLGILATEQSDYRRAQHYLQEGLDFAVKSGNLTSQGEVYSNLGRNYMMLGQNGLAVETLERGLQIAQAIENRPLMAEIYFHLADARSAQDAASAEPLYHRALVIARQDNLRFLECEVLISLAETMSKTRPKQAQQHSQQAIALAQEVQNSDLLHRATAIDQQLRALPRTIDESLSP